MADTRPNIVQAEFFLARTLNQNDVLLKDVVREIRERAKEGGASKLSVRFYDRDGALTRFVLEIEACKKRQEALRELDWSKLGLFRRWRLDRQSRRLARKAVAAQVEARELATTKLAAAVQARYPIAIEDDYEGPLRPAKQSELHELLESARSATATWLFIFKPNDLFADSNKLVASYSL